MSKCSKTRVITTVLVAALAAVAGRPAPAADVTEVLDQMVAKLDAYEDFSAKMTAEITVAAVLGEQEIAQAGEAGQPLEMRFVAEITAKNPDKFAMDMEMNQPLPGGQTMKMKMKSVCDGATMWNVVDMGMGGPPMIMKGDMEQMKARMGGPMGQMDPEMLKQRLETLREQADLALEADETVNEVDCYVVAGSITPEDLASLSGQEGDNLGPLAGKTLDLSMALGKEDFLPRKIKVAVEGKPFMELVFSNIKLNAGVADSAFTYTPPEGANVMDMGAFAGAEMPEMPEEGQEEAEQMEE